MAFVSPTGVETLTAEAFDVNKSSVVFLRDANPIMIGLIETENGEISENGNESLKMGGPDLALGYLNRRLFLSHVALNMDQFNIVGIITNHATASFSPAITLVREPASTSGVIRQREFWPSERKFCFELLQELAAVENGFDFCSGVTGSQQSLFTSTITIAYPQLYRRTGFTLALGKNISNVQYTKDGKSYANYYQVGGADSSNLGSIPASAQDVGELTSYPYLMRTESRSSVIDQNTLTDHAERGLRLYSKTPIEYTLEVNPNDPDCQVGTFRVGDEFRVIMNRGRLDVDSFFRVVEWNLSVDSEGAERLTMVMMETGNVT
jgi:hypothetical protein